MKEGPVTDPTNSTLSPRLQSCVFDFFFFFLLSSSSELFSSAVTWIPGATGLIDKYLMTKTEIIPK